MLTKLQLDDVLTKELERTDGCQQVCVVSNSGPNVSQRKCPESSSELPLMSDGGGGGCEALENVSEHDFSTCTLKQRIDVCESTEKDSDVEVVHETHQKRECASNENEAAVCYKRMRRNSPTYSGSSGNDQYKSSLSSKTLKKLNEFSFQNICRPTSPVVLDVQTRTTEGKCDDDEISEADLTLNWLG